jgi:YgiT-type zinc finger domain-containing protein
MDICNFCGNKNFNAITTQYTYKRNGDFMIVDDVPCEQCEYCGEQYFRAKILKEIESEFNAIYSNGKQATRTVTIPIESYAELAMA